MLGDIFTTLITQPMYNGLLFFMHFLPWADLGIAIILFTVFVRIVILPLSLKAIKTQQQTKLVEPQIKKLRKKHKDDKEKQMKEIMAVYREHNIRPFAGFLVLLVQFPVLIGLYWVFLRSGLPEVSRELLYPFVSAPESIDVMFLGLYDVTDKVLVLALVAGVVQFIQTKIALPSPKKREKGKVGGFQEEFGRAMSTQMKYVFPIVIVFIAYQFSAAIALYLITSSTVHILQEVFIKRRIREKYEGLKDQRNEGLEGKK